MYLFIVNKYIFLLFIINTVVIWFFFKKNFGFGWVGFLDDG